MEMPKTPWEAEALYKEATGEDYTWIPGETPREAAFRLYLWTREYIDDNSRGNSVKTPPAS